MTKKEIKDAIGFSKIQKILKNYPKSSSSTTAIKGWKDYIMGYSVYVDTYDDCISIGWISQGFESTGTYKEIPLSIRQKLIEELVADGFNVSYDEELNIKIYEN